MNFTEIDFATWPRAQMFYYFSHMAPTAYSLTVNADVSNLKKVTENANVKFFPAYLWLITKNLNKQIEFKVAIQNEKIGYFDILTPLYASFHDDDKTFSLMWTEFNDDFNVFYRNYIENQQKFKDNHGVLSQPETMPPQNAYTVSCIPWINFQHFSVYSLENKPYFFPSVEAGKFIKSGQKTIMPLSLTCHHATTDGYHISVFLKDLQSDMDTFSKFI